MGCFLYLYINVDILTCLVVTKCQPLAGIFGKDGEQSVGDVIYTQKYAHLTLLVLRRFHSHQVLRDRSYFGKILVVSVYKQFSFTSPIDEGGLQIDSS